MGYYDNVKDDIKDKGSGSSGGSNFDTLKKAAEETSGEPEEEKGDDTPIEVLEEGGLGQRPSKQKSQQPSQQKQQEIQPRQRSGQQDTGSTDAATAEADLSGLEDKLDRIIQQNDRMIEILESFGS